MEQYLPNHIEYLEKQYALGNFIISGRKIPRTGGIILSTIDNKDTLWDIIHQDPFYIYKVASYDLIEFVASKTSESLHFLKEDK